MTLIDVEENLELFVELQNLCKKDNCEERFDKEWKAACHEWGMAKEHAALWKEVEEMRRQELIKLSGSKSWKGGGVRVEKITRRGVVDYSSVPDLIGVDLEQYRKPASESWRITRENDDDE